MMPHVVACLARILDGGFQVFIAFPLHGKEVVFLLQPGVAVQAVGHHQKDGDKPGQQKQKGQADDDIALQNPAGVQRLPVVGNHEQIEPDKNNGQNPEYIPGLGEVFILNHFARDMAGRIAGDGQRQPAYGVIAYACFQAEPQVIRRGIMQGDGRVKRAGQAAQAGEYRADRQGNRSGLPQGDIQRPDINRRRNERNQRQRRCGRQTQPIAKQPTADGKRQHQGKQPAQQARYRLPQIGLHGHIGQKQGGNNDRQR